MNKLAAVGKYIEIDSPADFKTGDMPPATGKVPPVTPWK